MPATLRRHFLLVFVLLGVGLLASPFEADAQRNKRKRKKNQTEQQVPEAVPAAAPAPARPDTPLIRFDTLTYHFGTVEQGDVVRYSFRFENTGGKNLQIERVKVSCGCTVSSFPEKPIKPSQTGAIDVTFNSAGKIGPQEKTVMVYTNAPESVVVLKLYGEVQSQLLPERRGGQ